MRTYTAVVERDVDTGLYVGYVPGFTGAHTQGVTLDELNRNLREWLCYSRTANQSSRLSLLGFRPSRRDLWVAFRS
jgi:hypothetical protein